MDDLTSDAARSLLSMVPTSPQGRLVNRWLAKLGPLWIAPALLWEGYGKAIAPGSFTGAFASVAFALSRACIHPKGVY